jgi:hypothetical protein
VPGLLIFSGSDIVSDDLICSGKLPSLLEGRPCPWSVQGRMPEPVPLNEDDPTYCIDKGKPGDMCPPCCKQNLRSLGHWQGHGGQQFPEELLPLRLFKCRQWFWVVIPGLIDQEPSKEA